MEKSKGFYFLGFYITHATAARLPLFCYATSPSLERWRNTTPQVFEAALDLIWTGLDLHYDFPADAFPRTQRQENKEQRLRRETLIPEWIDELSWEAPDAEKRRVVTLLFYVVWSKHYAGSELSQGRANNRTRLGSRAQKAPAFEYFSDERPISVCEPFRPILITELLRRAAPCIALHKSGQYSDITESYLLYLADYFRPEVSDTFWKTPISRKDVLAIGGNTHSHQPGIYLHMLWEPEMADHEYFVYVGQSTNLCSRIRTHESPVYRAKNASLHYYVWDSKPDLQSAFIILAEAPSVQAIDLNILELWACLIFQSLPKHEISKYTPEWAYRTARGLNIANPLWQGTPGINKEITAQILSKTEHFTGLIQKSDPIRRQYLLDVSVSFSELRNSPNEILRNYFQELCWRRQGKGSKTKTSRTIQSLLQGCKKPIKAYGNSTSLIVLGTINLRVLRKEVKLKDSDTIFIQAFVSDPPVPGWYASNAGTDDPARRLRFWIEGTNEDGCDFGLFIHANGDQMVYDMNTIMDQIDGVSNEEIAARPRRRVPSSIAKGRLEKKAYT